MKGNRKTQEKLREESKGKGRAPGGRLCRVSMKGMPRKFAFRLTVAAANPSRCLHAQSLWRIIAAAIEGSSWASCADGRARRSGAHVDFGKVRRRRGSRITGCTFSYPCGSGPLNQGQCSWRRRGYSSLPSLRIFQLCRSPTHNRRPRQMKCHKLDLWRSLRRLLRSYRGSRSPLGRALLGFWVELLRRSLCAKHLTDRCVMKNGLAQWNPKGILQTSM